MRIVVIVACGAALLGGCQGPPLPIANRSAYVSPPASWRGMPARAAPRTASPRAGTPRTAGRPAPAGTGSRTYGFEELTRRAAGRETGPRHPGGVVVTDEMIARVERAVRLRRRAYEPIPPDRSIARRAADIPAPSKNGDGGGLCLDPSRLYRFLKRVLTDSNDR